MFRRAAVSAVLFRSRWLWCWCRLGLGPAKRVPRTSLLPEKREEQMQNLAREVADLEKLSGVLKKVVRLVRPTVVHIEADKPDPSARSATAATADVEEAGSRLHHRVKGQILRADQSARRPALAHAHDIKIRLADGRADPSAQSLEDPRPTWR